MVYPILTYDAARKILDSKGSEIEISLDFNLTRIKVRVMDGKVSLAGSVLSLADLEKLKENFCYALVYGKLEKMAVFSEDTNLYYKIMPTDDWPTFTLSSTPMHRHTHLSPRQNTKLVIKEVSPVKGKVLDTCCGFGYTAIMAAKYASEVQTFERDANVISLAELNPWSQQLFTNKVIVLNRESVADGIKKFSASYFDRVIHDPPTFKLAPELFSMDFYLQLYRVMKRGSILYHYSPLPHKTRGEKFFARIMGNLKKAGFWNVAYHEHAAGIRAEKR